MRMLYRVLRVTTTSFADPPTVTEYEVWSGEDTRELSELHPPSQVFGADDLRSYELEDGWIKCNHRFERFEGSAWVVCQDPRVRLVTGMTELEQEIDRENRRDFPGDYDGDDPDQCLDDDDEQYLDD